MNNISNTIKAEAYKLGFDYCKIVPVNFAPHINFFKKWIEAGRAGEMSYLEKHISKRENPGLLSDDQPYKSIIVLGVNYFQFQLQPKILNDPSRGIIASYAWGDDYHEIIRPLLYELDHAIAVTTNRKSPAKCLVDTGPVLERDWAHSAGVGFVGKNCCVINPSDGSWMFLATITIPEEVEYDSNIQEIFQNELSADSVMQGLDKKNLYGKWSLQTVNGNQVGTCGKCTRCLDACPTNAFKGPFNLDPLRCISYWTIEAKGYIPKELRNLFGNRIFGCDICQEVCPWNSRLESREPKMKSLLAQNSRVAPLLIEGFNQNNPYWTDQNAFSQHFSKSPIKRAKRTGMLRNVCVAMGNWANPLVVDHLAIAITDLDSLPRGHAAWALGEVIRKHNFDLARNILIARDLIETDELVKKEIYEALN